jgi:hypothetical protein
MAKNTTLHYSCLLQIVPLLVELLNTHCRADVSLIALEKLASLLPTTASVFEEHVETFLPKFISLAQNSNSMVSVTS